MSIYRHKCHAIPELNTASLPDLIFTILFFFMLVTNMRKVTVKVKYQVPQGKELTRLTKKSTNSYIYIGKPTAADGSVISNNTQIQLNDKLVNIDEVTKYMVEERKTMSAEDRKQMVVSIRADKATPMGTITDVKQALRKANALNINLAATNQRN